MKLAVYRGPAHVLRAGGVTLYRGEPKSISNELFARLSARSTVRLEEVEPVTPDPVTPDPGPESAGDGEEESDT